MQNNDSCILQCPTKLICLAVMQLLQEISSQYKALILSWRKEISLKKQLELSIETHSSLTWQEIPYLRNTHDYA